MGVRMSLARKERFAQPPSGLYLRSVRLMSVGRVEGPDGTKELRRD